MNLLARYRETPVREWQYLPPYGTIWMWGYRLRLKFCLWFNWHIWKMSEQWGSPDMPDDYIPARVICKYCGIWKDQPTRD